MKTLQNYIEDLRGLDRSQIDLAMTIVKANEGKFYSLDFLFLAALNRSRSSVDAFTHLIERENYFGAAPFIRMQLDSVLRLHALRLADDPNSLSHDILKGEPLDKKKDRAGERMTDAYLRKVVAKNHPWINRVYESGSGFIHLSEKHIFSLFSEVGDAGKIQITIAPIQKHIPEKSRIEAVAAMSHLTQLVIELCNDWAEEKLRIPDAN
ncbi:MAG TPA: hypothetical protein VK149_05865 [Sideroxyarcus sp.]|nr:hypothetical protein [Sideroxyarcus sp.]